MTTLRRLFRTASTTFLAMVLLCTVCTATADSIQVLSTTSLIAISDNEDIAYTAKIVPVKFTDGKYAGNAVQLKRLTEDGMEVHCILQLAPDSGTIKAVTSTSTYTRSVSWDPWNVSQVNLLTDVYYQFKYDTGVSMSFVRPDKVGVKVVGGSTSNISYITAAYWITGNKYSYPSCTTEASPAVVATSSSLSVSCVYNNPVVGGKKSGGTLSTTYAIGYGSSCTGKLRMAAKLTDGTKTSVYEMSVDFF